MASIADLERELHERQRAQYRRLQDAALVKEFTRREGRPPVDAAELVKRFPNQAVVPTLRPERYLSPEEIAAALAPMATG